MGYALMVIALAQQAALKPETGTAAEVTHLRSVDRILVGDGTMGPVTSALHAEFFGIVNGTAPDRFNWFTPVPVNKKQPVHA